MMATMTVSAARAALADIGCGDPGRARPRLSGAMDAFDADILIYAASSGHELGRRVRPLFAVDAIEKTPASRSVSDRSSSFRRS